MAGLGFLSSCTVDTTRTVLDELVSDPGWATVRHLHLDGDRAPLALLESPALKSLQTVTGLREDAARNLLSRAAPLPWGGVGLDLPSARQLDSDTWKLTNHFRQVFPAVRELVVRGADLQPAQLDWLWTSPFENLTKVGATVVPIAELKRWLTVFLARAPKGAAVEFSTYHRLGYLFRLSGDRRTLELRARPAWGTKTASLEQLVDVASSLAGTLLRVRVKDRFTKSDRPMLEKLLAPGGVVEPW